MASRRIRMLRHILPTVLALAAPAGATFAASPTIIITKPWFRYLLPNIPAAGYMVVQNISDTDTVLTGAASPACGMLMLHKSETDSGMAMMMAMQTITVPAHGSVTFAPGGYHLMCMQPSMKLGGQVPLTLSFQNGPTAATTAAITATTATITTTASVYGAQTSP